MRRYCVFDKWEHLGEHYLLDAYQFLGGEDFTGHEIRKSKKNGRYQYKTDFW